MSRGVGTKVSVETGADIIHKAMRSESCVKRVTSSKTLPFPMVQNTDGGEERGGLGGVSGSFFWSRKGRFLLDSVGDSSKKKKTVTNRMGMWERDEPLRTGSFQL